MLFPEIGLSREQILQAIAQALQNPRGAVFLDASLLIHCYEMSEGARDELLGALERLGDRVRVPLWAARETWEWSIGPHTKFPLQSHVSKLRDQVERFTAEARRYVDDDTAGNLTKAEFEAGLDAAARELLRLSAMVEHHKGRPEQTSAVLMPFIEKRRLNSQLVEILERVSKDAPVRALHRIPPGFGDARFDQATQPEVATEGRREKPKGKTRNPYGDQIIWQEILDEARTRVAEELLFITQDVNKGDWVYKPKRIRDENGRLQENVGSLTLAHPLLVQEAIQHCPGLKHVHIISVATFALVLRNLLSQPVSKLVAALQSNEDAAARHGRPARASTPTDSTGGAVPAGSEIVFRSSDLAYEPGDTPIDHAIRQLAVVDWTVQNQAVENLEPLLLQGSRDQLVQLGRALANAVNASALKPLEFLKRILRDPERAPQIRSNLLVGTLASVYLNDAGDPKKPKATPELTDTMFDLQGEPLLAPAYAAVLDRLQAQRRAYLGYPTDVATRIPLVTGLERHGSAPVLRSIAANGADLLEEAAPESRRISTSGQDEGMTVEQLLFRLSAEFAIPVSFLQPDLALQQQLVLPANTGFVRWGPGTGVTLR
jgi:hypothetical protein